MQKSEKNFKKGLLFIGSAVKISFCTVAFRRPWILPKEVFGLPNIKSAKKRVLIAEARNARNKAEKSALKTAIKKANAAIDANAEDKTQAVQFACKKIDQAAAKNLLHKNTAARKKSNLVSKLNRA